MTPGTVIRLDHGYVETYTRPNMLAECGDEDLEGPVLVMATMQDANAAYRFWSLVASEARVFWFMHNERPQNWSKLLVAVE